MVDITESHLFRGNQSGGVDDTVRRCFRAYKLALLQGDRMHERTEAVAQVLECNFTANGVAAKLVEPKLKTRTNVIYILQRTKRPQRHKR